MAFKKRGKEQYTEKTASFELLIEITHSIPALSDQCLVDITGVALSTVFQSSKRVGSSITVTCHESADSIISDLLLQIGNAKRRIN